MVSRILIDAITMSHPQPGGYKTYTSNLVRHLQLLEQPFEFVVAVDRPMDLPSSPGWRLEVVRRQGSLGVIFREQFAIPKVAATNSVQLIHSPAATGPLMGSIPQILTLYDTIEFSEPLPPPREAKRWGMRVYSRFVQKHAAKRARHIITISHYSKGCITGLFSIPEDRITVIHLAPSPIFMAQGNLQTEAEVERQWHLSDYVLGIASVAKRKNTATILQAYSLLSETTRRQHPLVLVCTHQGIKVHLSRLAQESGVADQVRLLDNVADRDLAWLYGRARVFVFPSLEEGFGLPPLEAMACGVPVVASNVSSMPEVLEDAAVLVPPTNVRAIADAVDTILRSQSLTNDLRQRGFARARLFSWEQIARQTAEVYGIVATEHRE